MTRVRYGSRSRRLKKHSRRKPRVKHGGAASKEEHKEEKENEEENEGALNGNGKFEKAIRSVGQISSELSAKSQAKAAEEDKESESFIDDLFTKEKFVDFFKLLNEKTQSGTKVEKDEAKLDLLFKAANILKETRPEDTTNLLNLLMALMRTIDPNSKIPEDKPVTLLPAVEIGKYVAELNQLKVELETSQTTNLDKSVYLKKILDILSRMASGLTGKKDMYGRFRNGLPGLPSLPSLPSFRTTPKSQENINKEAAEEKNKEEYILEAQKKISEKKYVATQKRQEAEGERFKARNAVGELKKPFFEKATELEQEAKRLEEEASVMKKELAKLKPSRFGFPSFSGGSRKRSRTVRRRSRKHSRR